jgi:amidophosphoribosyltransferase
MGDATKIMDIIRDMSSSPNIRNPFDHPKEECGVVAVHTASKEASRLTFFGLFALQHRGQESAGIAASDGHKLSVHSAMGLAAQVFHEHDFVSLAGEFAIGHTRYSTTGTSQLRNAQPFLVNGQHGDLALAHNGNITNSIQMKQILQKQWDCNFTSTSDTEIVAYLLANAPGQSWEERAFHCMRNLEGAYSLVALTETTIMAFRDPLGIRPLCLGQMSDGWVIASESCAVDQLGAKFVRELEPGEVVVIDSNGLRSSIWPGITGRRALCVFELIYFARPDSILDAQLVYTVRRKLGAQLANEYPVEADLVIGIPDSSTAAAVGYSLESGIPYSDGLIKNRYVGRTFIEPDQRLRDLGVRQKFNPLSQVIRGQKLVVVDDSIVRGTTTPHVVSLLRKAGASEVHMRICAPPIQHPCYMGVDIGDRHELIAANQTVEEIREYIGADTLGFLSVDGLMNVVGGSKGGFCNACFTGDYPVPIQLELNKQAFE